MARPADLHRTVFKRQPGAPRSTGFARRQVEHHTVRLGPVRRHREQVRATRASADKLAVTAGPREQRKPCVRQGHPSLIEVTLAIGDQGHLPGVGKRRLGRRPDRDPAHRFLVLGRPLAPRCHLARLAGPDLPRSKPQRGAVRRVQRQQRMQKQTRHLAVAAGAKPAAGAARKAQMRGVLDRQNMAASRPRPQRRSCRRENLFRHHRPVGKKPPERHRAGPVAPQTAHDRALLFHKALGQKTPLFARRSSPKRPANRSMNEIIFTPSTNQSQMTQNHLPKPSAIKTTQPRGKMCARASLKGEGVHFRVTFLISPPPLRGRVRVGGAFI